MILFSIIKEDRLPFVGNHSFLQERDKQFIFFKKLSRKKTAYLLIPSCLAEKVACPLFK